MSDTQVQNRSSQFSLFKTKAAFRLGLERPVEQFKVGCLSIQMAPFKEKRGENSIYDWENKKVSIKIGTNDILKFLKAFSEGSSVDIFHKFGEATKSIKMTPKEGGGYFFSVTGKDANGESFNLSIPIATEEMYGLDVLFRAALPAILNWN